VFLLNKFQPTKKTPEVWKLQVTGGTLFNLLRLLRIKNTLAIAIAILPLFFEEPLHRWYLRSWTVFTSPRSSKHTTRLVGG